MQLGHIRGLDATDDSLRGVLVNHVGLVQHVEFFGGVATSVDQDGLLASRVVLQELGHVQHLAVDDDPAVVVLVVLGDLFQAVLLVAVSGGGSVGGLLRGLNVLFDGQSSASALLVVPRELERELVLGGQHSHLQVASVAANAVARLVVAQVAEQVARGSGSGNATEDDAAEQRTATETVSAVDSTSDFTGSEEAGNGVFVGVVQDLALGVDLQATHAEVQHGRDDADVELVVHLEGQVVEVFLAEGVLVGLGALVVLAEGVRQRLRRDTELLGQGLAALELLHQAAAHVVLAVPLDLFATSAVQNQSVRALVALPHLASHVIAVTQFVCKSKAVAVHQETTDTTESLRGQELDFRVGFLGIDETGRMYLNLLEVDGIAANSQAHLDAVTSAVVAVGRGQVVDVGSVFLQQRAVGEIRCVTTGGQDDWTVFLALSAVLDVFSSVVIILFSVIIMERNGVG